MSNFSREYLGFLKFLTRAKPQLISWFGPHVNNDACRILQMASREWDAMDDMEQKFFIIATQPNHRINDLKRTRFLNYLMQKRYTAAQSSQTTGGLSDKDQSEQLSYMWNNLTEEERQNYSSQGTADIVMDHVIEQRNKLHQIYEPLKLNTLEFLLKTKPRWPSGARVWYFKHHNISFNAENSKKWDELDETTKQVYDACANLDRRRYKYEKSVWFTKLVSLDLNQENLTLEDFRGPETDTNFDSLCTILESNKTSIPVELRKRRPRGPFSLFIEYHRYQIRDEKPEFKFGEHLRSSAEAWSKLTEEQKNEFREQSRRLKEARREEKMREKTETSIPKDMFSIRKTVHGPCNPSHLVPRRPNIINLYGTMNKIPRAERARCWNSLSIKEQEVYREELARIEESIRDQKNQIKEKVEKLKQLLSCAYQLEAMKVKMKLISSINKSKKKLQIDDTSR